MYVYRRREDIAWHIVDAREGWIRVGGWGSVVASHIAAPSRRVGGYVAWAIARRWCSKYGLPKGGISCVALARRWLCCVGDDGVYAEARRVFAAFLHIRHHPKGGLQRGAIVSSLCNEDTIA